MPGRLVETGVAFPAGRAETIAVGITEKAAMFTVALQATVAHAGFATLAINSIWQRGKWKIYLPLILKST